MAEPYSRHENVAKSRTKRKHISAALQSPDIFRISMTGIDGGGMSKLELESSPTVKCLSLVLSRG